jgi:ribosomal protein L18
MVDNIIDRNRKRITRVKRAYYNRKFINVPYRLVIDASNKHCVVSLAYGGQTLFKLNTYKIFGTGMKKAATIANMALENMQKLQVTKYHLVRGWRAYAGRVAFINSAIQAGLKI